MSNMKRDWRRSLNPKKRIARVFTPALAKPANEYDPETFRADLKKLSQMEMDAIREVEVTKRCPICERFLNTKEHFHKSNRNPDGWHLYCKSCRAECYKARRSRIKELVWEK